MTMTRKEAWKQRPDLLRSWALGACLSSAGSVTPGHVTHRACFQFICLADSLLLLISPLASGNMGTAKQDEETK